MKIIKFIITGIAVCFIAFQLFEYTQYCDNRLVIAAPADSSIHSVEEFYADLYEESFIEVTGRADYAEYIYYGINIEGEPRVVKYTYSGGIMEEQLMFSDGDQPYTIWRDNVRGDRFVIIATFSKISEIQFYNNVGETYTYHIPEGEKGMYIYENSEIDKMYFFDVYDVDGNIITKGRELY